MLFAADNVALINEFFVPVITDPDWAQTKRRNPEAWTMSESWKDAPRSAQILWVVSANKTQRAGLYYQVCAEPEDFTRWLRRVLILDGHITDATDEEVHGAVLQHLHSALHSMWRWQGEGDADGDFYREREGFQRAAAALAADGLCTAAEVPPMLKMIRLNPPAKREPLRDEIQQWLDTWAKATRNGRDETDRPWLRRIYAWHKAKTLTGLDDAAALESLARLLRSLK